MNGADPLKNARHEKFAQARALGVSIEESWKDTVPINKTHSGGGNALRAAGSRVQARSDVTDRINYLRREITRAQEEAAEKLPRNYTKQDIIALYLEISEVLENAYEAAKENGGNPASLAKLRSVHADHLSRQGAMLSRTTTTVVESNPQAKIFAERINRYG